MEPCIILPEPGKRNILVTSALPYVNNYPHLGNIVGSVLSADVFARQTSTQQQTDIAQEIFLKLNGNGLLEERTTIQPYCEKHSAFLADRYVEGTCPHCQYVDARGDQCDSCGKLLDPLELLKPRCKLDNAGPVPRETRHLFLLLDKLQDRIQQWNHTASKKGAWSSNGVAITDNWLREGLKGRSITRDLKWGTKVPLPGYEEKCLYSWFDACIGYISITANYTDQWRQWWYNPEHVQLYQFMGKDNVPFHTVIFPGSQIGSGEKWTKLHHLSTTEYLNYENGKFSKSRNIGVFGTNAKETGITSDIWRYYLLSRRPENGDTEFEWKAFIDANNNELLKNLGNFVNRLIKFVNANFASIIPNYTEYTDPALDDWSRDVDRLLVQYISELEAVKIKAGLSTILRISSLGNKLLQTNTLNNQLALDYPKQCATVIGLGINLIHLLGQVLHPYMPTTGESILRQLNIDKPVVIPDRWNPALIPIGHKINNAEYLFTQIKPEKEKEWREQFGGGQARLQREEKASKAAARKADKLRKKATSSENQGIDTVASSLSQVSLET
ncbi:hypothetical protein FH972_024240 [Carpinus fangiana]|uniref:methionine--tRNA ligase n=1 Tax=Carpinus fangiana TaxID=176857 RepID=A0A5N6KXH1_9ROSI|nr:hypothetical protein FH972_024240 [Carpinus fangiana]